MSCLFSLSYRCILFECPSSFCSVILMFASFSQPKVDFLPVSFHLVSVEYCSRPVSCDNFLSDLFHNDNTLSNVFISSRFSPDSPFECSLRSSTMFSGFHHHHCRLLLSVQCSSWCLSSHFSALGQIPKKIAHATDTHGEQQGYSIVNGILLSELCRSRCHRCRNISACDIREHPSPCLSPLPPAGVPL